ncbi:hypothetical protein FOL46_005218 [Perkinsus olseni]|uniref:PARG catalytic Macro domain-containing protein n=1 Tax=Perkinsus olseni TaxID=32597 RepID=A0A7J6LUU5_PEROL|nr:hypothetical protein FOL46_005218 [Perkinsus olseni]
MFFACFPPQPCPESRPDCDFSYIREKDVEKACCLLSYFKSINDTAGKVKIRREYIKICRGAPIVPANLTGASKLCEVKICDTGGIEDAHGLLQADFANRFIGGGVLEGGNVQEEIRFSICPELVVTMLLCEVMNDHEAIRIEGATRFSCYSGYGGSFKWTGEFDDPTPLSGNSIRDVSLFCVDALPNPGVQQYSKQLIEREIRKFYCGVCKYSSMEGEDSLKGVATGNWGCGVFGGDPQLKFVVGYTPTEREITERLEAILSLEEIPNLTLQSLMDVYEHNAALFDPRPQEVESVPQNAGTSRGLQRNPTVAAKHEKLRCRIDELLEELESKCLATTTQDKREMTGLEMKRKRRRKKARRVKDKYMINDMINHEGGATDLQSVTPGVFGLPSGENRRSSTE